MSKLNFEILFCFFCAALLGTVLIYSTAAEGNIFSQTQLVRLYVFVAFCAGLFLGIALIKIETKINDKIKNKNDGKKKLVNMLVNSGMFQSQAEEVIKEAIPVIEEQQKMASNYKITWDRPADEYPEPLYHLWFEAMKPVALDYIKENCFNAWFKPILNP